jgi:cyclase
MRAANLLPQSKHFIIELLGDHVWAAIATIEGAAWANAGIVDLGERVIVFDSMWAPQAARDLKAAAEALTGRQVDYVINSHMHSDHCLGNMVFDPDTNIITAKRTQELLTANCEATLAWWRNEGADYLHQQELELGQEQDMMRRGLLGLKLTRERQFVAALPEIEVRTPNLTFNNWMLFQSRRRAEALSFGMGHTESDVFLHLPREGIVFMGDLLSVGYHPSLGDGDPLKWLAVLNEIYRLGFTQGITIVVPGHGPVGKLEDIFWLRRYLDQLIALVRDVQQQGGTADDAAALHIPAPFDSWYYPNIYADNMRFLYQWLARGRK